MRAHDALAAGYRYPRPGHLGLLREAAAAVPAGGARRSFRRFVDRIGALDPAAWEELHTRTLDLSPLFAPYVGYVMWGESYHRGAFLADLTRAEADAGIDPDGELADHLDPVLRYLGSAERPLPELVEVVGPAVEKMHDSLKKAEPGNPYVHLLAATRRVVGSEPSATGVAS